MKIILRDGSGTMLLKHVVEDVDRHGNVRLYYRRKGFGKVRLRSTPGSEAFHEEYKRASSRTAVSPAFGSVATGSLQWLIREYYASAEFKRLKRPGPRRGILDAICKQHGPKPYALMEPRHVRKLRDERSEHPEAANGRLKALRQVFAWGVEAGYCKTNPARDVPYIRTGSDGHHTWTVDEVNQFEKRHPRGSKARLALDIFLYTGARRSDAARLGPQMERDGELHFTEVKNGGRQPKARVLPILPRLRRSIDATPSGHLAYLVTTFGKPFTAGGLGNWFRKRCDEAGLPHCSAHGLRKAGATIAAERGATESQLMAIFGWESPKQAALYTRHANRRKLARDAMHLLEPERKMDKSVPPESGLVSHRQSSKGNSS